MSIISEAKQKKKRKPGLTLKQQKYKANRIKGMSQYNAARAAGYSESFCQQACRIERSVKVSIKDLAERMGITDRFLIEYAEKALEAEKTFTNDDGEIYFGADWNARDKFYAHLLRLTERVKPAGINIDQSKHSHITQIFLSDKLKSARERILNASRSATQAV